MKGRTTVAVVSLFIVCAIIVASAHNWVANYNHFTLRIEVLARVSSSLHFYNHYRGRLPKPVIESTNEFGGNSDSELYSWRVEIIPYVGTWHGSWDATKSWNDPSNHQLIELSSVYSYESMPVGDQRFPNTNVVAITGLDTAFGNGLNPPKALREIPPHTILAIEVNDSGIPWPAPGDFDIPLVQAVANRSTLPWNSMDNFFVIFADGTVWCLSSDIPYEEIAKFFQIASSGKHDRETVLAPFRVD